MHGQSVLGARHLAAALRTCAAGFDAIVHAADLLAVVGTGVADFSAHRTNFLMKSRAAQHEVGRRLANLGAIDHQTKMCGFDIFATCGKAMRHRGMQTGLVAMTTGINAGLHGFVARCVMGLLHVIHECVSSKGLDRDVRSVATIGAETINVCSVPRFVEESAT